LIYGARDDDGGSSAREPRLGAGLLEEIKNWFGKHF